MKAIIKIFVLSCILTACSNNEPPTITNLSILNTNSEILKEEGAQLKFSCSFSDDNGLSRFRLEVIDNFVNARIASKPWNRTFEYDLSGTTASKTDSITLPFPDLEPGRYRLIVTVQDIDQEETSQNKTFHIIE